METQEAEKEIEGYVFSEYVDEFEQMQFNVIFSKRFGYDKQTYNSQEDFLESQYLVVQKYLEDRGNSSFGLFRMDKLD